MNEFASLRDPVDLARAPGGEDSSDAASPLLVTTWRIVRRRRWIIGGAVAAALIVALLITLFMTRQYTASATVEIARESTQVTGLQDVTSDSSSASQEFYQTQYGLLMSRSLAEKVATDLRLMDDAKFFQLYGINTGTSLFDTRNTADPKLREARTRLAGGLLLRKIDVAPTRMSQLVTISFTSPDAALSARVANEWTVAFIATSLARKMDSTAYARHYLEDQLNQLRIRLERSERDAAAYAAQQRIINLPVSQTSGQPTVERSVAADDLVSLNQRLAQAISDRITAQSRFEAFGNSGANAPALQNGPIGALRQQRAEFAAQYAKLMVRFEPDYPEAKSLAAQIAGLDRAIQGEVNRVSTSLRNEYRSAVQNEQELQTRVNQLKNDVLDIRSRSIQYNILQREADTNRQLYDALLQRYKSVGIAGGVGVNNVSIVDPAVVPGAPSRPRVFLNLLAGLLGGLLLGFGIAVALEQLEDTIATPDDVMRKLHLAILGAAPKTSEEPLEALTNRKSALFDSYLSIQTSLGLATPEGVPFALAVTSTRAAEGKSTTSLAIAATLARQGRRVLLMDCDMRSPSVHGFAGVANEAGLSSYLANQSTADMIQPFPAFGIDILPAGPIPPNAADLLTGDGLDRLLTELKSRYDHVIMDAPPVLGLADAILIGNHAHAAIYVIESGGMRTPAIQSAVHRLRQGRVRLVGAILTKFDPRKVENDYSYSYGSYGYGYGGADAG